MTVAVKKFKEKDTNPQVKKTALREIRMLKTLKHQNIVSLLEIFRRKAKLYLVFDFVEHTVLEELERKSGGLDSLQVKKIMYQLLIALRHCHSNNVVHRDIKPENLLVTSQGVLKLCDFGFARSLNSQSGCYTDYVSTRWYRAPELLVGDTRYGKQVDIWSCGCLLAELLTGIPLFPGESDIDTLQKIMKLCGNKLPSKHVQAFYSNPLYEGVEVRNNQPSYQKPRKMQN